MPRKRNQIPCHSQEEQLRATTIYIAMVVRNAMEDFHVKHLSDVQMAELNPIIRNAIYTALYAVERRDEPEAQGFLQFNEILIPSYWEPPKLLDSYPRSLSGNEE
jgi:hypothetical protein